MKEKTTSLDAILGDFSFAEAGEERSKTGTTLTIWVPIETKERYNRIQEKSGRKFSSKLRELLEVAIATAEARVAC